mmetsp:Transcript_5151/g.10900  ORF Transcript_5151/g.10900 Transcript_5151/m.10900 type:complete len:118 (+) Transcript_5151:102-455(+)
MVVSVDVKSPKPRKKIAISVTQACCTALGEFRMSTFPDVSPRPVVVEQEVARAPSKTKSKKSTTKARSESDESADENSLKKTLCVRYARMSGGFDMPHAKLSTIIEETEESESQRSQ